MIKFVTPLFPPPPLPPTICLHLRCRFALVIAFGMSVCMLLGLLHKRKRKKIEKKLINKMKNSTSKLIVSFYSHRAKPRDRNKNPRNELFSGYFILWFCDKIVELTINKASLFHLTSWRRRGSRVCQLRGYLNSFVATGRYGTLPMQRLWTLLQDERAKSTTYKTKTTTGKSAWNFLTL